MLLGLESTRQIEADAVFRFNEEREDDPASQPPGMAPMRFEDWFKPFNEERTMPPYALPRASSTDPQTP